MNIARKIIAVAALSTAALGVSTNASAHSGATLAAIAVGGIIIGTTLSASAQPAVAPVVHTSVVTYKARPVYHATPVHYRTAHKPYPQHVHRHYRPNQHRHQHAYYR